jgi:response regulator RpfG family c-di-GMP phosphodiesterase
MSEKILFVDDEKFVLDTFRRNLRKHFEIETAEGPMAAFDQLERNGPFAVVVSDLKMPKMNGVEFLSLVKTRYPDSIRIMLTGQGDLNTAVAAVNQGSIFRFLTKPCSPDALLKAVNDGLRQHRLIMAERQLLHGTLRGCIQILSELLSLASPKAFGRGEQSKPLISEIVQILGLEGAWMYELAGMLSQIGCISLPPKILESKINGERLSVDEERIFLMHPGMAGTLLRNIPRLESVAEMVAGQELPLDQGPCAGARILKVALDFTDMASAGVSEGEALDRMRSQSKVYDARIVAALSEALDRRTMNEIKGLQIGELREGMLLVEPVLSAQGAILMDKGQIITSAARARFVNFGTILGIKEPIYVLVKVAQESPSEIGLAD